MAELYISTGRIRKSLFRVGKSLILIMDNMKKTFYFSLMAFLVLLGCSKVDNDVVVKPDENQLKSARTATPITPWATPGSVTIWDNNSMLQTALWSPPKLGLLFKW